MYVFFCYHICGEIKLCVLSRSVRHALILNRGGSATFEILEMEQ